MRCEEFEIRLEEVLDERQSPASDPRLKEHADTCAACRSRVAAYDTMLAGLALCAAPSWDDPRLVERVFFDVRRPSLLHRVQSRPWTFAASLLATAALILIVVSLSLRSWNHGPQPGPDNLVHSLPEHPAAASKELRQTFEPRTLNELARAAGDKYMVLVRQTGESVAEVLELVPELPGSESLSDGASKSESNPGWASEMAQGFEPVTDSARSSLHSLWLAIPAADEDSRS